MDSLGIYISVPFCRAKCTFCNFASDVFASGRMDGYTDRLCAEIGSARATGAIVPTVMDSIYFGGGTPSLLQASHVQQIFTALRDQFEVATDAEITLECAPGQLSDETLEALLKQGLNRVSLGIQSFVDAESAAVGRLHTREMCLQEIERLRAAGVQDLNVDLIAGLPMQTEASWCYSVEQAIATGSEHVSVYMLEVDEESRLGREALAQGSRYHAGQLPPDDAVADWYGMACAMLNQAGIAQYEISNFARPGHQSKHNLKYWTRAPYLGFGLDAHSLLRTPTGEVRTANVDSLDSYMAEPLSPDPFGQRATAPSPDLIGQEEAFEESLFLGLRLNKGVRISSLQQEFGPELVEAVEDTFQELAAAGLLQLDVDRVSLTDQGRLLSNEVFSRMLLPTPA